MAPRPGVLVALSLLFALLAACGGGASKSNVVVSFPTRVPTLDGTASLAGGPTETPTPAPPPELVLSTEEVYQGGSLLVSVTGAVESGTALLFGEEHSLIQGAQSKFTFVGVAIDQEPGTSQLQVQFTMPNGTKGTLVASIDVLSTDWTVDSLSFTERQTEDLLDPYVVSDENKQLAEVYATDTPEKLWEMGWQVPVDAPLTARFGEQRSINGGEPEGHHGGTDIGAEQGTPVHAANHGRVVMARQMALRGNMVIIDHGGGVLTGYAHLAEFGVAEGQMVKKGEVIATVGNTGLSTGAHLHWEMAVDGVMVDPYRFIDGTNGF
jgi:hypothetical protein